jgi:LPS-assembly lipoprotein
MKKILRFILLLILTSSFISCGYQLRGAQEISFKSISIDGGSKKFSKILKKKFNQSGVKINAVDSEISLEIINDNLSKEILSLSSKGKVREYQITYRVTYRVKSKDGEWGSAVKIETSRDYTFDDTNIISKTEEELRIIKGMQDQLIRTMVTQISILK